MNKTVGRAGRQWVRHAARMVCTMGDSSLTQHEGAQHDLTPLSFEKIVELDSFLTYPQLVRLSRLMSSGYSCNASTGRPLILVCLEMNNSRSMCSRNSD